MFLNLLELLNFFAFVIICFSPFLQFVDNSIILSEWCVAIIKMVVQKINRLTKRMN